MAYSRLLIFASARNFSFLRTFSQKLKRFLWQLHKFCVYNEQFSYSRHLTFEHFYSDSNIYILIFYIYKLIIVYHYYIYFKCLKFLFWDLIPSFALLLGYISIFLAILSSIFFSLNFSNYFSLDQMLTITIFFSFYINIFVSFYLLLDTLTSLRVS